MMPRAPLDGGWNLCFRFFSTLVTKISGKNENPNELIMLA